MIKWMGEVGVQVDWTEDVTQMPGIGSTYKAVVFGSTSRGEQLEVAINGDFFEAEATKDVEGKNTGYVRGKAAAPAATGGAQMPDDRFPVEVAGGVPVVTVPEEVDITNAEGLRSALLQAAATGPGALVVDMTRTRFCDSSGCRP